MPVNAFPSHGPEDRWRRTVEQRGRPLKLKVGRLLKEFGHASMQPGVGEAIESRLARVGLQVRPPLHDVTADQVITLEIAERAAVHAIPAPAAEEAAQAAPAERPPAAPERAQPVQRPPERTYAPPPPPPPLPPFPRADPGAGAGSGPALEDMEQSTLVRAAVEAERRVRNAYDRAAAASSERVAGLERELAAEREATARARDERDELERRLHVERREAASRLQALAAAERTARGLLEAQRAELSNLTQTVRVSTAAIAQTRETLDEVHGQVQQTAADVRDALTEIALPEPGAEIGVVAVDPAPADDPPAGEPAQEQPGGPEPVAGEPAYDEPEAGEEIEAITSDEPAVDERAAAEQQPEQRSGPRREPPATARTREAESSAKRGRGRGGKRRRVAMACAVCGRPGKTRDPKQLAEAGWRVEGDVALCLTCVADDWKLDEGDSVPHRSQG